MWHRGHKLHMNENELMNVENEEVCDTDEGLGAAEIGVGVGIAGAIFGICMGIKAWIANRKLKQEREKNKLYQELIRKHQVEIDALKNDREREVYKEQLWAALKAEK